MSWGPKKPRYLHNIFHSVAFTQRRGLVFSFFLFSSCKFTNNALVRLRNFVSGGVFPKQHKISRRTSLGDFAS